MGYEISVRQPVGKKPGHEEKATPTNTLATTLQKYQKESGRSVYQLSNTSGVDGAYIWRILRGERCNVSREILIRLSIGLALDYDQTRQVVDVANDLLDAAGFKGLR